MAASPSADLVGNSFVSQYYNVLHQSPSVVHRFYTDESKVTRDFGSGTVETLTSQEEIQVKFMSMDFSECKAEIKSVDAQNSLSGGVILMVTGVLSFKSTGGRNFVQTFFLAPQEKGYFVLNDAFRYVDAGVTKSSPYAMANGVAESTVSSVPETDEHLEAELVVDEISGEQYVVSEDNNRLVEEADDELLAEPQVIDEPVVEAVPDEAPAAVAAAEEFHGEPTKKSYASIVNQLRMAGGTFLPKPAPSKASAPQSQQPAAAAAATPAHDAEQETPSDGEGDKRAVYVKNLPVNISEQQIEAEFRRFGPLKPGGIQVRTQKQQNGCYAFIEFEDPQSAANSIEASGFQINGRAIHVEEKKVAPGGPRRFSQERSGGGRGGARNFYGGGRGGFGDREAGGSRGFNEPREGTTTGRGFGRRTEITEEGGFRRYENQRSQRRGGSGASGGGGGSGNRNGRNVD